MHIKNGAEFGSRRKHEALAQTQYLRSTGTWPTPAPSERCFIPILLPFLPRRSKKTLTSVFTHIHEKGMLEIEMVLSAALTQSKETLASAKRAKSSQSQCKREDSSISNPSVRYPIDPQKKSAAYPSFRKANKQKISLRCGQPIRKTPCQCVTIELLIDHFCPVSQISIRCAGFVSNGAAGSVMFYGLGKETRVRIP
jgi:hypothetical protein